MNKYPIGIQDFDKIREGGYLYVDKTQLIHKLIDSGSYYFLSRPRRFGKSLMLSTISAIFNGRKELFEGLWIHDQWNWEQKHPVIHLKLSSINYQKLGLYDALNKELDVLSDDLGVILQETDLKDKFRELIEKSSANGKVVILIDEYDKPIVDYLDDLEKVEEHRAIFKSFYSVLKDADPYIRLLLMTGVSRFTKVSIFSDLNNLNDITIHRSYATLTGITQQELEFNFSDEIAELQQQQPDFPAKLKLWYNGYSWHPDMERVYNPFSILRFMDARDFENYWFLTGTPTWLVKHMRNHKEYTLENLWTSGNALSNFNVAHISSIPVLFQTGYLTIKAYDADAGLYELGYPNKEVESSLLDNLLSAYRDVYPGDSAALTKDLVIAFRNNDIASIMSQLNAMISSIPFDHWKAESESIFHIIAHLTFKVVGLNVQSEVHSAKGRCDILVLTSQYIYALELKLNGTAEAALSQIIEKGYLDPYQADTRKKIAIGVNFSSETRAVEGYLVKEV
jgi:hypothetical protein